MKPIDENLGNRYFTELAVALKRDGLETMPLKDGQLPVLLDGHPICQISGGGSARYGPENMITETLEHALQKATDTAETKSKNIRLMETALILKPTGSTRATSSLPTLSDSSFSDTISTTAMSPSL